LLAAIAKNPHDYAPTTENTSRPIRRRNETLALMAKSGFVSPEMARQWQNQPIDLASPPPEVKVEGPAVVAHVLDDLKQGVGGFGVEDLAIGRAHVHTTADGR